MKNKTIIVGFLIACQHISPLVNLYAQLPNEQKNVITQKDNEALVQKEEKNVLASVGFDIQGAIHDSNGKTMDGVEIEITYSRPDFEKIVHSEKKTEMITVNSRFHIQAKGWTDLELVFTKEGYYSETLIYSIDSISKKGAQLQLQKDVNVQMYKRGVPADLAGISNSLTYDFESKDKTICDLSMFQSKGAIRTSAKNKEEDSKDEAEEQEDKKPKMRKTNNEKNETTTCIETVFRKDEKGEFVFDNVYGNAPSPSSLTIRLSSKNPDDGFIVVDKLKSGFVRRVEYDKRYTNAPKEGYKKEISVDLKQKGANGLLLCQNEILFAFVRCGEHYGKVVFNPVLIDCTRDNKVSRIQVRMELDINQKEGDRNIAY